MLLIVTCRLGNNEMAIRIAAPVPYLCDLGIWQVRLWLQSKEVSAYLVTVIVGDDYETFNTLMSI